MSFNITFILTRFQEVPTYRFLNVFRVFVVSVNDSLGSSLKNQNYFYGGNAVSQTSKCSNEGILHRGQKRLQKNISNSLFLIPVKMLIKNVKC